MSYYSIEGLIFSISGNTAGGSSSIGGGPIVLQGGANITLSQTSNTIVIIGGAGGGGGSLNVSAGTTSNNLTNIVFSNSNGLAFGLNGSTLTGSYTVPSTAGLISAINFSAGTTSNNLSKLTFSDSNGVSFGLNGSVVTATVQTNYLTTAMQSNAATISNIRLSAGTTSNLASAFTFGDANNVSFGLNASTITATVTVASTQGSIRLSGGTTSNLSSGFTFSNSNNVSFGLNAGVMTATATVASTQASISFSGGTTSNLSSGFTLSNSNNVSFGLNAGVFTATASFNQTNQQMTLFGTSNTTQNTSMTWNASSMIFAGAGLASVGLSNGSLVISVPAGAPSPVNFSAGTTSNNLGSVVFSNSNGVSFGLNGSTITASAAGGGGGIGGGVSNLGNTAGSTGTVTTGNIVFVGSGPISLSQSTGAAGSNATISIIGPATSSIVGANGIEITTNGSTLTVRPNYQSYFANMDALAGSQTMSMLQSTSGMFPFYLEHPLSVSFVRMALSGGVLAASSTAATTGNTQFSGGHSRTHNFVIYSRGTGASSQSLQSVTSTQITEQFSMNVSANANSTQFSYTMRYTFPHSTGSVGFTKDYSSSAASLNFHTSHITDLTGNKILDFPLAISLTPGQYWIGYGISSSTTSQFTNGVTRGGIAFTQYGASQANVGFGTLGAATNSSVNIQPGIGSFSVAGGGTSASIDLSQMSSSASQNILYFQFMRVA